MSNALPALAGAPGINLDDQSSEVELRGYSAALQAALGRFNFTDVTYSTALFLTAGWTVPQNLRYCYAYRVLGEVMEVEFSFHNFSLSGATAPLALRLPENFQLAKFAGKQDGYRTGNACWCSDNGTAGPAFVFAEYNPGYSQTDPTVLQFYKADLTNWSVSTAASILTGQWRGRVTRP